MCSPIRGGGSLDNLKAYARRFIEYMVVAGRAAHRDAAMDPRSVLRIDDAGENVEASGPRQSI
jgi:hypothetical protein